MADETTQNIAVDKPLASLAEAEKNLEGGHDAPQPEPEPMSAAQRLRAFEDAHVGPNATRLGGMIERGVGSPFSLLSPQHRGHYAALERLADAEADLATANHNAALAQTAYDQALAAADNSEPA